MWSDGGGANKHGGAIMNTLKLDNETENMKHKTVSHDVGKAIMQARQAKGLTQKDLATVGVFFSERSGYGWYFFSV